jgi:acetyltransferase-like isoleucine patch superfamily enzyme
MSMWRPSDLIEAARGYRARHAIEKAVKLGLRIGRDYKIAGIPRFGEEPYLITIGNHVGISEDVEFLTHDGSMWLFRQRTEFLNLQRFGRIEIGDDVFIGARSIVMPGVRIGSNSVVGAGSIVTRSVPPNSVVAGAPARYICSVDDFLAKMAPRCLPVPKEIASNPDALKVFLLERVPGPDAPMMAQEPHKPAPSTNGHAKVPAGAR